LEFVPEDESEAFMNQMLVATDRPASRFEANIIRSDGEIRTVESIVAPTRYRGKAATLVVHRDVTECCQSATMGQIGTRENYCYGEPALSFLTVRL